MSQLREILVGLNEAVMALVLLSARISGFLAASPLFSRHVMSRFVRAGVALSFSLVCVPPVAEALSKSVPSGATYLLLMFKEVAVGYFLAMLVWLPFRGLEVAGAILDAQSGIVQSESLDVVTGTQATPTAIVFSQIFACYLFSTGGFLVAVSLLLESMAFWPPSQLLPDLSEQSVRVLLEVTAFSFFQAAAIALPISGFMFLADVAIIFLARIAPSLNCLTFASPIKSASILALLIVYLEAVLPQFISVWTDGIAIIRRSLV
ncbi:EscT/YscT/HrcT family type III secretion system export apparatus protein [Ensifer sp. SL37]|uniref:EscT/YscT/HrcT family type III secretion system export apparatus protein n=1 Tax=Ensifer sp. SL37 TaxID=2995137 RepID=UPI0022754F8F|nr:flagellar biosynthetic protein FliR [Ensifer sp. SL37]MCY1740504.1 flagellar biosynthetic protein FliR [Ensifer sp. SL37]